MNKKLFFCLVITIFALAIGPIVSAGNRQGSYLRIKGFKVTISNSNSDKDVDSNWRRVTGGASMVEVVETTEGSSDREMARISRCQPNDECLKISVQPKTPKPKDNKIVLFAKIEDQKTALANLENFCKLNYNRKNKSNLVVRLIGPGNNNSDTVPVRQYILSDTFCTDFDAGDYSPNSEANLAILKVNVGKVEFK
jgi:hypothetical protein